MNNFLNIQNIPFSKWNPQNELIIGQKCVEAAPCTMALASMRRVVVFLFYFFPPSHRVKP